MDTASSSSNRMIHLCRNYRVNRQKKKKRKYMLYSKNIWFSFCCCPVGLDTFSLARLNFSVAQKKAFDEDKCVLSWEIKSENDWTKLNKEPLFFCSVTPASISHFVDLLQMVFGLCVFFFPLTFSFSVFYFLSLKSIWLVQSPRNKASKRDK